MKSCKININRPAVCAALQARRSRRSSRSNRQHASPIPSDSTAVLRDPQAAPYRGRLRSRMPTTAAQEAPASSSMHNALAAEDTTGHQASAGDTGPARQTRSLRSRDREGSHGTRWGAAAPLNGAASGARHAFTGDGTHGSGAGMVQGRDEQHQQQHVNGGRALRSRRGRAPQPDEAQLQSDDDAQLAQALQESMLSAPAVRRSGRNTRATGGHQAGHEGRLEEAVGPSHAGPSHAGPSHAGPRFAAD